MKEHLLCPVHSCKTNLFAFFVYFQTSGLGLDSLATSDFLEPVNDFKFLKIFRQELHS